MKSRTVNTQSQATATSFSSVRHSLSGMMDEFENLKEADNFLAEKKNPQI